MRDYNREGPCFSCSWRNVLLYGEKQDKRTTSNDWVIGFYMYTHNAATMLNEPALQKRAIRSVHHYRKRGNASYIVREWLLWEGERERERETPLTSLISTLKSRVIMHMITSTARRPNASTRSDSDWGYPDNSAKDKSANDTSAKPEVRMPTVRKRQQCEWDKSAKVKCAKVRSANATLVRSDKTPKWFK